MICLEITAAQLDYLVELVTLDVALSLMKLGKLQVPKIQARLELRTNANKMLLNDLKAKQHEATTILPNHRH
jgi:hypothetical protein